MKHNGVNPSGTLLPPVTVLQRTPNQIHKILIITNQLKSSESSQIKDGSNQDVDKVDSTETHPIKDDTTTQLTRCAQLSHTTPDDDSHLLKSEQQETAHSIWSREIPPGMKHTWKLVMKRLN